MFLARRLDAEALALQRQGELGLWLMSLGQEAAQVGSIRALRETDYVFPSYREHAAALARGIGPADLLRQWRGVAHAGWDPRPYRFHFYSLVLGTQTLHATGYAMGVARDGTDEIVMTYFGDGASSEGDVSEALNWASVMAAPVLFFCQNNHWAISTPDAAAEPHPAGAAGSGLRAGVLPGRRQRRARGPCRHGARRRRGSASGHGPAFIEADTYRMAGHSTSDDPTKYRDRGRGRPVARPRSAAPRAHAARGRRGRPDLLQGTRQRGGGPGRGHPAGMPLAARTADMAEFFGDRLRRRRTR